MELFDVIKNNAVGDFVQNFELRKERNGLSKEDVEELLRNVCSMYEQSNVNQVSADEHLSLKAKSDQLEHVHRIK